MTEGQNSLRNYFSKITLEDRVPHALLMVGPEGAGQLSLALEWCKMLFCKESEDGQYCGECKSCQKISEYVHPDIHFSFPVVKHEKFKREETTSVHFLNEWRQFMRDNIYGNLNDWLNSIDALNKNANINVAECHRIIHNLGLKSYEGSYKIQIIWHAESLMKEGNRLLKLIEEPAEKTIIILLANNINSILNTIQSRCQILRVPAFTDEEVKNFLAERYGLSDGELNEISYLSEGNLRKAIEMAQHSDSGFAEEMLNWFRMCYKADPEELLVMVEKLNDLGKVNLKGFLRYTLHFLREYLMAFNMQSVEGIRLSEEEKNVVLKMQKILNRDKTSELYRLINRCIGYIDRNLSVKIMLMDMSLKINKILRSEVNKFA